VLQEVDNIKITILVDNITDRLLPSSPIVERSPMISNQKFNKPPIAEHGFSALLEISYIYKNEKLINKFLFDTGVSENGVIYNSDIFGINFGDIETIVLSHGHFDHFSGLVNVLKKINKPTKIIMHPDALLKRWIVFPNGNKAKMDTLNEETIRDVNGIIIKRSGVNYLPYEKKIMNNNEKDYEDTNHQYNNGNKRILLTGEIPRITSFEKGFPLQYKEATDESNLLIPDPLVKDDQALVMNLKNKGLVILSGCGHAGIINTIKYATKVTGIKNIFAVIGGFHLTGEGYEKAISLTINELKTIDPKYIIPCHCTGWKASNEIIKEMPHKYIQTSVGSTFVFNSLG